MLSMKRLFKLLCISLLLLCSSISVFAITPPFKGGPITSGYGPRNVEGGSRFHEGLDIGVDDTYIHAPADGYVQHDIDGGFGEAHIIFWFGEKTEYAGQALLFGDLGDESNYMNGGLTGQKVPVKEGDIIGVVHGFVPGQATGPHAHIEYHPGGQTYHYASDQVGNFLKALGMDLSGNVYTKDYNGSGEHDTGIPWNVQALMGIGNSINDTMVKFQGFASKAYDNIHTYALTLLFILFATDIVFLIILSGFELDLMTILSKLVKLGIFIFLVNHWKDIVNTIFKGFITLVGTSYAGTNTNFLTDVSQPQLLLQKAISLLNPALNKIASFGARDFISNIGTILPIYILTFLVIGIFILVALYIMICYLEFYISGALSIITVPFGILHWSKFIPEGFVGHLTSSTIKLMLISVLVGLTTIAVKDVTVTEMFSATVSATETTTGIPTDTSSGGYVGMIYEEAARFGVDPAVILAIAMRESGGDTIDGIHMTSNMEGSGAEGIMQTMPGQDGIDENGNQVHIDEAYPGYQTDPRQNIRAGIAIFKSKLDMANGNIPLAIGYYYGDPTASYTSEVLSNYESITGRDFSKLYSSTGHKNPHKITTEQLVTFLTFCTILIALALLILKVPEKLMKHLGGQIELP